MASRRRGGLCGRRRRNQVNRLARVDHAASGILASGPLDGQRLPAERGLVQHSGGQEPPIHRDDLPRAHEKSVAGDDVVHRDLDDAAVDAAPGCARGTRDQQAQLAARSGGGTGLQKTPTREHHRDHGTGEVLINRKGAG